MLAYTKPSHVMLALTALLWSCFAGCDNPEPAQGRAAASEAQVASYCDAWKAWNDRCAATRNESSQRDFYAECKADPRWPLVWDEAMVEFDQCFRALDCNGSDDRCLGTVLTNLGVDAESDPLYAACMDKAHACEGVLDDECAGVLLYYQDARDSIQSCLSQSCGDFGACLKNPLGSAK